MTPQIILHIGAPKCGSTYVQRVMLKNQQTFRQQGIHYPHAGQGHPGNADRIDEITHRWVDDVFSKFSTVVLSHENLFALSKKGLRLKKLSQSMGFDLRILAFFRSFSEIIFADYSQTLRQNFTAYCQSGQAFGGQSFEDFARHRHGKIIPDIFFRDWQDVSPDVPLVLRHHTDIRPTLEKMLDHPEDLDWNIPSWRRNPSMPLHHCTAICTDINAGHVKKAQAKIANSNVPPMTTAHEEAFVAELFKDRSAALKHQFGFVA